MFVRSVTKRGVVQNKNQSYTWAWLYQKRRVHITQKFYYNCVSMTWKDHNNFFNKIILKTNRVQGSCLHINLNQFTMNVHNNFNFNLHKKFSFQTWLKRLSSSCKFNLFKYRARVLPSHCMEKSFPKFAEAIFRWKL